MARDHIVTFRVDADELDELESAMETAEYDTRAEYCRDAVLGRIRGEDVPHTPAEYAELHDRVQELEEAVFNTNTDRVHDTELRPDEPPDDGLAERIRAQLPKGTSDAEADAVVAIAAFLRDEPEQWASPKEIRDAVHAEHPAGSQNPEWWWKKMAEWIEHVDCVDRVHQRRVEWVGVE